ncbi:MAG: hypothetical protein ABEI86_09810, partial [Halobacteriaceae archaeon]
FTRNFRPAGNTGDHAGVFVPAWPHGLTLYQQSLMNNGPATDIYRGYATWIYAKSVFGNLSTN